MSAVTSGVLARHRLISADSHVEMPDDAWAEYLDPDLRERGPRLEVSEEGVFRVFEGRRKQLTAGDTLGAQAGNRPEAFDSAQLVQARTKRSGANDPAQRLRDQDADHVGAEVLYAGGPLVDAQDADLRLRSYRAYNRWLADFCRHAPDRLIGAAAVPVESADGALAELRRAVKDGFRTAYIPLWPDRGSFADPDWDAFWAELAELRMPIGLHIGGLRGQARRFDDPGIFMTQNLMARMGMAEALGEIVLSGVLERHPALRIVSVEAQVGWLPFAIEHMDRVWHKHRHWSGSPLPEPPSHYFARQVHATFTDDPAGIREARQIGTARLMWSSDFPHSETYWPKSLDHIASWADALSEDELSQLLWRNAATLYGTA
jgi:predicted TIM-barrel fold metal-dependent hydrolase